MLNENTRAAVMGRLNSEPWAMHPTRLQRMVRAVAEGEVTPEARKGEPFERVRGTVAVVPVHGPIDQRSSLFTEVFGGVGLDRLTDVFGQLVADSSVGAIVLDIDSPGGSVFGLMEAADTIYQARGTKPIVAVADSWAASAAYWLASQADEVIVTPSGEVGSIGVWTAHVDESAFLEALGVKVSIISAGRYKVEGNPFQPLDDEARAELQRGVDLWMDRFVGAVARGRRRAENTVREKFGEGRMVEADRAVSRGMADRVATLETVTNELAGRTRRRGRRAGLEKKRLELRKKAIDQNPNIG